MFMYDFLKQLTFDRFCLFFGWCSKLFLATCVFFWNSNKYVYTYLQDFRCWHQIALSHKPPQKAAETTKESDKEIMGRFRTLRIHQVCPKEGDLYLKSYTHQKLTFSHQKTWMVGLVVCFLVGVCLFSGTLREGIGTLNLHWLGTVFRKHWGAPLPSDALDFAMPRSGGFGWRGYVKRYMLYKMAFFMHFLTVLNGKTLTFRTIMKLFVEVLIPFKLHDIVENYWWIRKGNSLSLKLNASNCLWWYSTGKAWVLNLGNDGRGESPQTV